MNAIEKLRTCKVIFPHRGCKPCMYCRSCEISADELADAIEAELSPATCTIDSIEANACGCYNCWLSCGHMELSFDRSWRPSYCSECGAKVVES